MFNSPSVHNSPACTRSIIPVETKSVMRSGNAAISNQPQAIDVMNKVIVAISIFDIERIKAGDSVV